MTTELVCVKESKEITKIDTFHLPRWSELPSIDLYIDQIISLIDRSLGPLLCHQDGFPLTKSMINNYVKARIVDAPVNKKYPRLSVAMIFVVCILKNCYTTEEIGRLIKLGISLDDPETTYNRFCDAIEKALREVFSGDINNRDEHLAERPDKYLMENFALSFACKFYVQKTFLNSGKL
ncbi:MAG: DUF1836 domain-containing protein [Anaerovoracaceae bacterium]|nr:DUF1836 domain-containing protein [Anaerovoracaceae bacterium]